MNSIKQSVEFDPENPYADWAEDWAQNSEDNKTSAVSESAPKRKPEKRYYWLKLKDGFFDSKYIKALRAGENGDRITIVYLSMQLRALRADGFLKYDEIMPSFEEEIALDINEDVEIVKQALSSLQKLNLIEIWDDKTVYMACKQELLDYGSETAAAERKRRSRQKQDV